MILLYLLACSFISIIIIEMKMGGIVRLHNQHSFIGRRDNGVEGLTQADGGAIEIAAVNTDFSQQVDAQFRMRILMTWQANATGNRAVRLRYNLNGTGYNVITTTSTVVKSVATSWYSQQSNSTEGITYDGPPPPGPPVGWDWADNTNSHRVQEATDTGVCNYHITNGEYMSAEFCIVIIRDDVDDGDTIQFRLQRANGVNLNNYLITPTVTVLKPASVGQIQVDINGGTADIKGGTVDIN